MVLINGTIIPLVICVTIYDMYKFPLPFTRDHYDPVMKDLTKKGVKSRKGLSWDFLARLGVLT